MQPMSRNLKQVFLYLLLCTSHHKIQELTVLIAATAQPVEARSLFLRENALRMRPGNPSRLILQFTLSQYAGWRPVWPMAIYNHLTTEKKEEVQYCQM
jgi:hypothetical protein